MDLLKRSALCLAFLSFAAQPALAQEAGSEAEAEEEDETLVVPIEVEAPALRVQQGRSEYNAEFIENMPTGQGDLADLLRMNPAVDFSRDADISGAAGTLRPAEISIHGQTYYQNLFLIDGADTSSDINPAADGDVFSILGGRNNWLFNPLTGSSPQGYYLDVELLDKVEVYDSNIPVEFGGFNGGVVSATVKSYQGEDTFSWHFGMQRDEWEEFHINEDDLRTAADRYNGYYTPDYQKTNFGVSLQQALGDNLGLTLGLTRRQSRFAQQYEDGADTLQMVEYEDHIDNLMGRLDTKLGNTDAGLAFRYTTRKHDGVTSDTYTGSFVKDHQGFGFTLDLGSPLTTGLLDLTLSLDRVSDSIDSELGFFTFHEYREGSSESRFEGGYGDLEQQQTRFSLKPKWSLDPLNLAGREHTITMGGEYRNTRTYYERPEDVVFERYDCLADMGREGCRDMDGSGGSSAGDERLGARAFYYAGKVDLTYNELSVYAEDRIDLGGWQINLGLRGDWGSYLENFDVSPRISVAWAPFEDGSGELTAGASRYYGRSFFRYQLNDAITGWRENYLWLRRFTGRPNQESPCSVPDFEQCTHIVFDNRNGVSELETPYSDEISLGWRQRIGPLEGKLQLLTRESRKGVSRKRDEDRNYFYDNDGRSSTRSATMEVSNSTALVIGPTETRFTMGLGYRDSESNVYDDYHYDETLETDLIYYRDALIPPEELPAWDYNIPISARLNSVTAIPRWGLTWSNFYIIRRGGTVARDTREDYESPETGARHDIYEDHEFSGLFTINSRIKWSRMLTDGSEVYARFEIHNLLDRVVDTQTIRNTTRRRNTQGRRFWMEVGMRYF